MLDRIVNEASDVAVAAVQDGEIGTTSVEAVASVANGAILGTSQVGADTAEAAKAAVDGAMNAATDVGGSAETQK